MAAPIVDLGLLGDKELARKLAKLATPASQKRSVRPQLKKSAKRLKDHLVVNLSGKIVKPDTGRWLAATEAAKVKAIKRSRTQIGSGFSMPTREELGIPAYVRGEKQGYYPYAIEYGYTTKTGKTVAPKAPIRLAVNEHAIEELRTIGRDVGKGIEKEASKPA